MRIEIATEAAVPYPLVQAAAARTRDDEVDEVWCFIDVEAPTPHPRLSDAFALADRSGVRLAVSNPCFELWIVLHERDWTRPATSTADMVTQAQKLAAYDGKHLDTDSLLASRHEAARRAHALARRHATDGTVSPHDNPSTGVVSFIEQYDPEYRKDGCTP